jgi:hypothetical protein
MRTRKNVYLTYPYLQGLSWAPEVIKDCLSQKTMTLRDLILSCDVPIAIFPLYMVLRRSHSARKLQYIRWVTKMQKDIRLYSALSPCTSSQSTMNEAQRDNAQRRPPRRTHTPARFSLFPAFLETAAKPAVGYNQGLRTWGFKKKKI